MAEPEYIPTYPTIAFASRADHLAWIAAQNAEETEEGVISPESSEPAARRRRNPKGQE